MTRIQADQKVPKAKSAQIIRTVREGAKVGAASSSER